MDKASLEQAIDEFLKTGKLPAAIAEHLRGLSDEGEIDAVMARLKAAGAHLATSEPLKSIKEYYVPGEGKYELRWPIASRLPMPFAELDRETQFFVLFGEWTRCEFEGMHALTQGDLEGADLKLGECIERARQIDVAELEARSCEGLMRVAQRRDDPDATRRWLDAAMAIRERMS